jgi:hypothetical protein
MAVLSTEGEKPVYADEKQLPKNADGPQLSDEEGFSALIIEGKHGTTWELLAHTG